MRFYMIKNSLLVKNNMFSNQNSKAQASFGTRSERNNIDILLSTNYGTST